jgi:hypothetical protein
LLHPWSSYFRRQPYPSKSRSLLDALTFHDAITVSARQRTIP